MNKDLMKQCGFTKEVERVEQGKCSCCSKPIYQQDFRDVLSVREYNISGLCQQCQDFVFGEPND
jgi:hypothetical protein